MRVPAAAPAEPHEPRLLLSLGGRAKGSAFSAALSLLLHAGLIGVLVWAPRAAGPAPERERVTFIELAVAPVMAEAPARRLRAPLAAGSGSAPGVAAPDPEPSAPSAPAAESGPSSPADRAADPDRSPPVDPTADLDPSMRSEPTAVADPLTGIDLSPGVHTPLSVMAAPIGPPVRLPAGAGGAGAGAAAAAGPEGGDSIAAAGHGSEPRLLPLTVWPRLVNSQEVADALRRSYPEMYVLMGVGGTAVVWIRLDPEGRVLEVRLKDSSGMPQLDRAALEVARVARFTPAILGDQPVHAWITQPVTFAPR